VLSATWFADQPGGAIALRAPAVLPPWTTTAGDALVPHYLGAAADLSQTYASGERRVHLYVAQYVSERQGEELVNDLNRSIAAPEWRLIDARPVQVRLGSDTLTARQETLRDRYGQTRVAWTWFWVSGEHTVSPVVAKWLRVKGRLLGRSYNAAAIVMSTEDSPYRPAQPVLQDFLEHCPMLGDPVPDNGRAS
jgi:EpsI family protein